MDGRIKGWMEEVVIDTGRGNGGIKASMEEHTRSRCGQKTLPVTVHSGPLARLHMTII